MSMNNLTIDGEFRYIIQWFSEWSELQRDDFIPVMVSYITDTGDASWPAAAAGTATTTTMVNMNGLQSDMERSLNLNGKPMSLFQCRVKLFNQWNRKWPTEFKDKLKQKITEIDSKVGERIEASLNAKLNGGGSLTNGFGYGNSDELYADGDLAAFPGDGPQGNNERVNGDGGANESKDNDLPSQRQQHIAQDVLVSGHAVTLQPDVMQEVLNNETSVDDIEPGDETHSKEAAQHNDTIVHTHNDDAAIDDDCRKQQTSCTTRPLDGNANDGQPTIEPVPPVVQLQNLQINEEDHEDVTASAAHVHTNAAAAAAASPTTVGPVTVTVNPVVVVTTPVVTTNTTVQPVV